MSASLQMALSEVALQRTPGLEQRGQVVAEAAHPLRSASTGQLPLAENSSRGGTEPQWASAQQLETCVAPGPEGGSWEPTTAPAREPHAHLEAIPAYLEGPFV